MNKLLRISLYTWLVLKPRCPRVFERGTVTTIRAGFPTNGCLVIDSHGNLTHAAIRRIDL